MGRSEKSGGSRAALLVAIFAMVVAVVTGYWFANAGPGLFQVAHKAVIDAAEGFQSVRSADVNEERLKMEGLAAEDAKTDKDKEAEQEEEKKVKQKSKKAEKKAKREAKKNEAKTEATEKTQREKVASDSAADDTAVKHKATKHTAAKGKSAEKEKKAKTAKEKAAKNAANANKNAAKEAATKTQWGDVSPQVYKVMKEAKKGASDLFWAGGEMGPSGAKQ
jgi:outer membrane biosynthesis protein TonB